MPSILSTKKLLLNQKELLLNAGMALVEYNAVNIEFPDFPIQEKSFKNAIITSKNGARAIINQKLQIKNCFCVGEKTAAFLRENSFYIEEWAHYAEDLARAITKKYPEQDFSFFCGNRRRETLPSILNESQINFKEIRVYKTQLNFRKFNQEFDGILFFSPSSIKSFTKNNQLKTSIAFCIGKTTAAEAKKHTEKVVIATTPTIENVIVQVVKIFRRI